MLINTLKNLVEIPSDYPNEKKISEYIFNFLKRIPGTLKKQKVSGGRWNILFESGSGQSLLFLAHMDTVPVNGDWSSNPYKLVGEKDKLYGLGVWDMKAGLAVLLESIKSFQPKSFKIKIAFVVDEENYSLGTNKLIQSGFLNDVSGCISLEPGFVYGERGICLGRVGRSVFDVTLKTLGGHTYLARNGQNAIKEASFFIEKLTKIKKTVHPKLGESNIFPRYIFAEAKGMSIPSVLNMQLEANTVPPQTTKTVLNEIKKVVTENSLSGIKIKPSKRPTPFCQPYVVNPNTPFVKNISAALAKTLKKPPVFYYRNSVADDNRIALSKTPVVTIGPRGGNAHAANEWVSLKSMNTIFEFLKELMLTYNKPS